MPAKKPRCFGAPAVCRACRVCGIRAECFEELDTDEWTVLFAPAPKKAPRPVFDRALALVNADIDYEGALYVISLAKSIPKMIGLNEELELFENSRGHLLWKYRRRRLARIKRADGKRITILLERPSKLIGAESPKLKGKREISASPKRIRNLGYPLSLALKELVDSKLVR